MSNQTENLMVEDAQIIFRNFAGKESQYNREGDRNFCVVLDQETAERMINDGWNVRNLDAREEGEAETPYIQVAVNFKNKPPKILMISAGGRTVLDEASVEVLDYADIKIVDLIANPYHWTVGDKSGIKAYLKSMYVTLEEDELDRKYAVTVDEEYAGEAE